MSKQSERRPLRLAVNEARESVDDGNAIIVDVLGAEAFKRVPYAIKGARRMNPDQIEESFDQLPRHRTILTYCTCDNDEISARVAYFLRKQGYEAYAIEGGLQAWREAGYPVEEKAAVMQDVQGESA